MEAETRRSVIPAQALIFTHIFAIYANLGKGKEILQKKIDQESPEERGALREPEENHSVFASPFWSSPLSDKKVGKDQRAGGHPVFPPRFRVAACGRARKDGLPEVSGRGRRFCF